MPGTGGGLGDLGRLSNAEGRGGGGGGNSCGLRGIPEMEIVINLKTILLNSIDIMIYV